MKNKGFTLVEILAVVVILGLLVTIAAVGVTRYRRQADEKDLLNLHSSLETSFDNYRTVLAMSGDVFSSNTLEISNNESSDFDQYIKDLAYNGQRLDKSDLNGTVIKLTNKGLVLNNPQYTTDIIAKIGTSDKTQIEQEYIKDATCIVNSTVSTSAGAITKKCKEGSSNGYEPSKDELVCMKIFYKNELVIDDFGENANVLSFNKLCKYVVDNEQ